jgi:His/Glu/Gln/Arg/opine family amino acid ABC transporter permease subunit
MSDHLSFLIEKLPVLLFGFSGQRPGGLLLSLILAVLAVAVGFCLAVPVSSAERSGLRPLRWCAIAYVEFFRGLPLILLLVLVHQGLGGVRFGLNWSPRTSALVALALYSSAYQAEILRAGLAAVPLELVESARLMGSRPRQVYILIKLRYALRVMLPAFTGQAISLFKDTSVVVVIGVAEVMTVARMALGADVTNAPYWVTMYTVVGVLYFALAFTLSRLSQRWERRSRQPDLVHSFFSY